MKYNVLFFAMAILANSWAGQETKGGDFLRKFIIKDCGPAVIHFLQTKKEGKSIATGHQLDIDLLQKSLTTDKMKVLSPAEFVFKANNSNVDNAVIDGIWYIKNDDEGSYLKKMQQDPNPAVMLFHEMIQVAHPQKDDKDFQISNDLAPFLLLKDLLKNISAGQASTQADVTGVVKTSGDGNTIFPTEIPDCKSFDRVQLRSVLPGFKCQTAGGYVYQRVEGGKLGESWVGPDNIIWGDFQGYFSSVDGDKRCQEFGGRLPKSDDFERGKLCGLREVLPNPDFPDVWGGYSWSATRCVKQFKLKSTSETKSSKPFEDGLRFCSQFGPKRLQQAQTGFKCRTKSGHVFERVNADKLGVAWRGPDGVIWGDFRGFFSNKDGRAHCKNLGARLPSFDEFDRGYSYNFVEVLSQMERPYYWTRTHLAGSECEDYRGQTFLVHRGSKLPHRIHETGYKRAIRCVKDSDSDSVILKEIDIREAGQPNVFITDDNLPKGTDEYTDQNFKEPETLRANPSYYNFDFQGHESSSWRDAYGSRTMNAFRPGG